MNKTEWVQLKIRVPQKLHSRLKSEAALRGESLEDYLNRLCSQRKQLEKMTQKSTPQTVNP